MREEIFKVEILEIIVMEIDINKEIIVMEIDIKEELIIMKEELTIMKEELIIMKEELIIMKEEIINMKEEIIIKKIDFKNKEIMIMNMWQKIDNLSIDVYFNFISFIFLTNINCMLFRNVFILLNYNFIHNWSIY